MCRYSAGVAHISHFHNFIQVGNTMKRKHYIVHVEMQVFRVFLHKIYNVKS